MKANLSFLKESMDKAKIELEAENGNEEVMLNNIIRRHGIDFALSRSVLASIKISPPAGENSPMKLEIVL